MFDEQETHQRLSSIGNPLEMVSKVIDNYEVTDASVHDSQPLDDLLTEDDSGQDFFADSAYTGE
ncbi:MAG: hypothetical protein JJE17_00705, partial [Peptostreptococcaceae bacterium]|nr:hypothetical protein [Peptostreptococcaceae bacterium]